jgi:hypothetical protein
MIDSLFAALNPIELDTTKAGVTSNPKVSICLKL